MQPTAKMYLKNFRALLAQKDWYPTWITNMTQIKLGDVGTLDNDYFFETKTSLKNLGVNFTEQRSAGTSSFLFKTQGGVDYQVKAAGKALKAARHIPVANAGVVFDFKKKGALYVRAAQYSSAAIPDVNTLESGVIRLMMDHVWKDEWCIVTHINEAPVFSFLICTSSKGVVEVSADTKLAKNATVELGEANVKFSVRFGNSYIFEQLRNENAVMAYQLHRVKTPRNLPVSLPTVSTPFSGTVGGRLRPSTPPVVIERTSRESGSHQGPWVVRDMTVSRGARLPAELDWVTAQPEPHLLGIVRD